GGPGIGRGKLAAHVGLLQLSAACRIGPSIFRAGGHGEGGGGRLLLPRRGIPLQQELLSPGGETKTGAGAHAIAPGPNLAAVVEREGVSIKGLVAECELVAVIFYCVRLDVCGLRSGRCCFRGSVALGQKLVTTVVQLSAGFDSQAPVF